MFDLKMAKTSFFDRAAVTSRVDKTTRRVLSKFGAFVRTAAKRSIRKRKRTSKPGEPPTSRTGLLRDFIFFAYDGNRETVVIGPAALNRTLDGSAPATLEYGGVLAGPDRTAMITNEVGRDASGRFVSGGKSEVTIKRGTRIEARPYMGPALDAERPKLEGMWRDSVR